MKTRIIILLISLSLNSFGQIQARKEWPISIQKEFNSIINKKRIDTVLVYYAYLGTWTNLPDSCNNISSVWIIWKTHNRFYYQQLPCQSNVNNKAKEFSGKSFEYFQKHYKDSYKLKQEYFNKVKSIPIETDGIVEYLIYMTKDDNIPFTISSLQRTKNKGKTFKWDKFVINTIDTIKKELKNE